MVFLPPLAISTFVPLYAVVDRNLLYFIDVAESHDFLPFRAGGSRHSAQLGLQLLLLAVVCGYLLFSAGQFILSSVSLLCPLPRGPCAAPQCLREQMLQRQCSDVVILTFRTNDVCIRSTTLENNRIVFCFQRFLIGLFLFEQDLLLFCVIV